jgi:hypothetical protein
MPLIVGSARDGNGSIGMHLGQRGQLKPGGPGTDPYDPVSKFVRYFQGLAAHRPGGAQDDERLAHRRPMARKYK